MTKKENSWKEALSEKNIYPADQVAFLLSRGAISVI